MKLRAIQKYITRRIVVLILLAFFIFYLLKDYLDIDNISEGFLAGGKSKGSSGKHKLPCVQYPKNADTDIDASTRYLAKKMFKTIYDLDSILGDNVKKSPKVIKTKLESYMLKVEDNCKTIKVDGKEYSYDKLLKMENMTSKEKRILNERNKEKDKLVKEKMTETQEKKIQKLGKSMQQKIGKFNKTLQDHGKKKKKGDLTDEKIQALIQTMLGKDAKPFPAMSLLVNYYNRIIYKSPKDKMAKNIIDFSIAMAEEGDKFASKLLKTKIYKLCK